MSATSMIPPHFLANYCLRCGTMFRDGQSCPVVTGGPSAKYHTIGLCIDEGCLQGPDFDTLVGLIQYHQSDPPHDWRGSWPGYFGSLPALPGFAKVSMLDNGLAFVGLHRGHVEHWSRREVRTIGAVFGSYASDYGMVGPPGFFPHAVTDIRFYHLASPMPLTGAWGTAENRYLHGVRKVVPRCDGQGLALGMRS